MLLGTFFHAYCDLPTYTPIYLFHILPTEKFIHGITYTNSYKAVIAHTLTCVKAPLLGKYHRRLVDECNFYVATIVRPTEREVLFWRIPAGSRDVGFHR